MTRRFEEAWARLERPAAPSPSGAGPAARSPRSTSPASTGEAVLCPSNTFMATPLAIVARGRPARVRRLQPRRPLHVARGLRAQGEPSTSPRAAVLVHIGGHSPSRSSGSPTTAAPRGSSCSRTAPTPTAPTGTAGGPARFGDAGVYSFYATKTVSTGEGGVLVSRHDDLLEYARAFRNYGKPDHDGRRPQLPDERVHRRARRWSRPSGWTRSSRARTRSPARSSTRGIRTALELPDGMTSGLYKYIVFDADRALDRQGLRPAVPPHHGHRRRPAQQRLGRRAPLVRPALLPRRHEPAGAGSGAPRGSCHERSSSPAGRASSARTSSTSCSRRPRAAHLRRAPVAAPRPGRGRHGARRPARRRGPRRRRCSGCDAVVHLAAAADVGDVAEQPGGGRAVNARGTLNVLEAARASGHRPRRLREHDLGLLRRRRRDGASTRTRRSACPTHLYTATKLAGEMYCRSYAELYGVDCTILRFGIPYGPRARPAAVIPIFVRKALAGEPLTIAGDGSRRAASSTSRTSPRASSAASRPQAGEPRLQPRRRRDVTIREIADDGPASSSATSRSSTPRAAPATSRAPRSRARAPPTRARLARRTPFARACAATSTGSSRTAARAVATPAAGRAAAGRAVRAPARAVGIARGRLGWPSGSSATARPSAFAVRDRDADHLRHRAFALRSLDDAQIHAVGLTTRRLDADRPRALRRPACGASAWAITCGAVARRALRRADRRCTGPGELELARHRRPRADPQRVRRSLHRAGGGAGASRGGDGSRLRSDEVSLSADRRAVPQPRSASSTAGSAAAVARQDPGAL